MISLGTLLHDRLIPAHMGSEADLPSDVADVVFVGGVAVDARQRERGGAAEDEPAVAVPRGRT